MGNAELSGSGIRDDRLGSVVESVEAILRLRVYSHKYSIISYLSERPGSMSNDVQSHCRSASSTYFKCLKELQHANIIVALPSSASLRNQHYDLAPQTKAFLESRHRAIGRYFSWRARHNAPGGAGVLQSVRSIEQELGVRYYSPEYEAIMFLYERGRASAQEICANSSSAHASFYAMLKRLAEIGQISASRSSNDRRQKWYCLSERTAAVLDEAHAHIARSKLI